MSSSAYPFIALCDQGGNSVADPEWILLLLQAFDRIALEDEVHVAVGCSARIAGYYNK